MIKTALTIVSIAILISCGQQPKDPEVQIKEAIEKLKNKKIEVLNFATFHMGTTTDAKSIEFDEESAKNQKDAKEIATAIARFKPTIICVETEPSDNNELNSEYQQYLQSPDIASTYYGEVGLIAFEVGRLSDVTSLHGIDHKLEYNYNIGNEMVNHVDSNTITSMMLDPFKDIPDLNAFQDGLSTAEKLRRMNHPKLLDMLIVYNADMLALVGSEEGYEGADEAAKYYQRNLRIYTNLNRIPMSKNDRVFILSGGSHTAFLNEFMRRSGKYEVVNTMDYLD